MAEVKVNRRGRISAEDLVFFNQQLSSLVKTGLPIVPGLKVMAKDAHSPKLRKVIQNIAGEIEAGKPISRAFAGYSHLFSPTYLAMIKAGEASGNLAAVLNNLAFYSQRMLILQKRIKEALVYPIILVTAAIGIAIFISIKFIPVFTEMIRYSSSIKIPRVISLAMFLNNQWPKILLVIGLLIIIGFISYSFAYRKEKLGRFLEKIKLNLPLYGSFLRDAALCRFGQHLEILLQANIPLPEALQLSGEASGNWRIKLASQQIQEQLKSGKPWTDILDQHSIFPHTFTWMIGVGDKEGKLEEALFNLSDFYDRESRRKSDIIVHFIEPILILILGILIALVAVLVIRSTLGNLIHLMGGY